MSRVSENSSVNSINYSVGKTKSKLEDLQLKGATLKRIAKPSDDPIGNVELLAIRSQNIDSQQYLRNLSFAQTQLSFTENILEDLTNVLVKAKELAIAQASTLHSPEAKEGVAKEVHQLREQALSLGNKRMGNRYVFAGQKILTRPFDKDGKYFGDNNKISIEINKDVFIPVNLTGPELFYSKIKKPLERSDVDLKQSEGEFDPDKPLQSRTPASIQQNEGIVTVSIFDELRTLENALLTNNTEIVQSLLERLDSSIDRVVSARTEIGALSNTLTNSETNIEKTKLTNEAQKSKIEDADVTELMSDMQKEQAVLKATYKASSNLMNTSLMDFLK